MPLHAACRYVVVLFPPPAIKRSMRANCCAIRAARLRAMPVATATLRVVLAVIEL